MEKVADYAGWREKRAKKHPNRGVGMACAMYQSESRWAGFIGSTAYVKVLADGRIRIISGEYEWGQGAHTILSQIAAEELRLPLEDVEFSELDTDVLPFTRGPYGGGPVTLTAGHAVRLAAIDAREKVLTAAAKMLGVSSEDLEMENRKIFVRGDRERSVSIATVASYARHRGPDIVGEGVYDPDTGVFGWEKLYGNFSRAYPFSAQVAEVEVDPETGQVKVLDFAAAVDLGKAINPVSAEGNTEGAVVQEIGTALMEEVSYEQGTVVNPNFVDYRVPRAINVPAIKTFLVETNDPYGPYGAKACGMTSNMPVAAALANAIYNAVGVRIKELPITPMKVLKALEERE